MAAVVQDITAEQGAALAVTFTGAGASLQGRTLRMHVRSKVGVTTTKLVASTTDGRLAVGANPYTTATLAIDADIMAAVAITLPTEYWVYDVESYTTAADVRREWSGRFTISRDVTRDTEADTETALSGAVLYSGPQSLTTAQKLQARDNIGAGTGGGGGGGSGDVVGPASATDDRMAAFDGTTGKLIKQGSVTATAVASHIGSTSNPHSVTAAQVGADPAGTAAGAVSTHASLTTGVHGITAAGAALLDDATAADQRTTLGLGTAATSATGDFAAASHAHAASAITSGTLVHERGGLEADVSAYSGLVKIAAGATSAVTVTAAGEALLDDADASAQRTTLGLVIGTNVQAYDADLTTWAGITPGTGVGTALGTNVGSAGAVVTNGGALGTPSSGNLANCTGYPGGGLSEPLSALRHTRQSSVLTAAASGEVKAQFRDTARHPLIELAADVGDPMLILPGITDPLVSGWWVANTTTIAYKSFPTSISANGTVSTSTIGNTIGAINYASVASSNAIAGSFSALAPFRDGSSLGDGGLLWGIVHLPDASYGTGSSGSKVIFGLHDAPAANGNRPGGNGALFEYNTNQSDTNWQFIVSDGGSDTITDTGLAFAAQATLFWMIHIPRGGSACYAYIRQIGGSGASVTAAAMPTNTAMYLMPGRVVTLGATARNIRIPCTFMRHGGAI